MSGTLYVVATPIGNLADISRRAIETLASVDLVTAEDTRHSGLLLQKLALKKPMLSYQEHNEQSRIPEILARLNQGQHVAIISDAGTPALSDPGFKLIRAVISEGFKLEVVPGPSSILVALVGSGLPPDKFYFGGFLPRTSAKRQAYFTSLAKLPATLIFFESPHRLASTLNDAAAVLGDRPAVVARELTKLHQQFHRGTLAELCVEFSTKKAKGEMVLVIGGFATAKD